MLETKPSSSSSARSLAGVWQQDKTESKRGGIWTAVLTPSTGLAEVGSDDGETREIFFLWPLRYASCLAALRQVGTVACPSVSVHPSRPPMRLAPAAGAGRGFTCRHRAPALACASPSSDRLVALGASASISRQPDALFLCLRLQDDGGICAGRDDGGAASLSLLTSARGGVVVNRSVEIFIPGSPF